MKPLLKIIQDHDADSPREWDNLGIMYCEHSRYNLGDKNAEDPRDENGNLRKDILYLPLYLYDHSGITMRTTGFSCPWDSGRVGIIYVTKKKIKQENGWKVLTKARKEKILQYLKNEVETYDQYLTGDIYGYVVEETEEEDGSKNETDSCWGFYGSDPATNGMADQLMLPLSEYEIEYSY